MIEWHRPEFEEIRMDAEINCYSSALQDLGAVGGARVSEPGAQAAPRVDGRASS